jgi:hypothetical protein
MSGNPSGRPKGSRNKSTLLLELMSTDDRGTIMDKIIRQARAGCRASQRLIVDRLEPPRKGRAAPFALPPVQTPADVIEALAAVTAAMAAGKLSPSEVLELATVVDVQRRAITTLELETGLRKLEERFK